MAIKVLNKVKKEIPNAILTMVGPDQGMLFDINKLIMKYDLKNNVKIEGVVQNNDLFKYYSNSRVFINTNNFESFGLGNFEAASSGVPVVSNRVGKYHTFGMMSMIFYCAMYVTIMKWLERLLK